MSNKRICITGSLGFIGFHVMKKLHQQGAAVYGLDNCNDYYDRRWKFLRLKALQRDQIETSPQDILDFSTLRTKIQAFKPTAILHLAAQAGVRYSMENPSSYLRANIDGTFHIFEIAKEFQIPVVFASSSSVYGQNQKTPFEETDSTQSPTNFYAMTKQTCELMASTYHFLYQIPIIGLRFFTVYGPYGRPDMAYFNFAEKMIQHQPILLFNGGALKRDFTYIDDIVDGIISALGFPVSHGVFNLGHHHPHAVHELVSLLEKHLGIKAMIEHGSAPLTDVKETFASIEKSGQILGFQPRICLDEGIKRFCNWYRRAIDELPDLALMNKLHPEYFRSDLKR